MSELSKQALQVENTTNFPNNTTGYITPTLLRGFNSDFIDSTVNQTQYTANSGSWNISVSNLNAFTASQQPTFNSLNAYTASQLVINTGVNSFTQSANGRLNNLEAYTASTTTSVKIYDDGTEQGTVNRMNFAGDTFSASVVNGLATITIVAGGFVTQSVFNSFTASTNTSIGALNSYTASNTTTVTGLVAKTGSYATTGSNQFAGGQQINGSTSITGSLTLSQNLIVGGNVTAGNFNFGIISASAFYSSGSSQFGDTTADIQTIIGTVSVTGPFYVNNINVTSSLLQLNAWTASNDVEDSNLQAFTESVNTRFTTLSVVTSSLQTFSASAKIELANLESTTASLNTSVSSLNTFSASQLTQNSTLGAYTASVNQTTASLNSYTASNDTKWNTLGALTGSYLTTGSLNISGSLTITGSVYGNIVSMSINGNSTASMDFSAGNLFTLSLPSNTPVNINVVNANKGETATLLITTATLSTASFSSNVKQPAGFRYTPSTGSAKDIITFITFDNTNVYATSINNLS
jgi:cytoskeletal protein CcmA (bactofilin family)